MVLFRGLGRLRVAYERTAVLTFCGQAGVAERTSDLYDVGMFGPQTNLLFLLPLRVTCGWVLATAGFGKIASGWLTQPHFAAQLGEWLNTGHTYRFFVPALHRLLPHAQAAGIAVAGLQLLCGAALFCGLFSRLSALGGLLLTVSYLLAAGEGLSANPGAPLGAALLTLTLCGSGRALGLDAALQGRVASWLS